MTITLLQVFELWVSGVLFGGALTWVAMRGDT